MNVNTHFSKIAQKTKPTQTVLKTSRLFFFFLVRATSQLKRVVTPRATSRRHHSFILINLRRSSQHRHKIGAGAASTRPSRAVSKCGRVCLRATNDDDQTHIYTLHHTAPHRTLMQPSKMTQKHRSRTKLQKLIHMSAARCQRLSDSSIFRLVLVPVAFKEAISRTNIS